MYAIRSYYARKLNADAGIMISASHNPAVITSYSIHYTKLYEEDMLEKSEKNIFLEVREGNEVAVSLYSNFGFRIVGKRKAYYSDTGEDAIVMMFEK